MRLFTDDIKILELTREQVMSKIQLSAGLPQQLIARLTDLIMQTFAASDEWTRDYMGYSLHGGCKLYILSEASDSKVFGGAAAGLDPRKGGLVFFAENIEGLSEYIVAHEFWHLFWYTLHEFRSVKQTVKCRIAKVGPPGAHWSLSINNNEYQRKLIADYCSTMLAVSKKLEEQLAREQVIELNHYAALEDSVRAGGRYYPRSQNMSCTAEQIGYLQKGFSYQFPSPLGTGFLIRIRGVEVTEKGPECSAYLTCAEHENIVCQMLAMLNDSLDKIILYQNKEQLNFFEPLAEQFSPPTFRLWLKASAAKINFEKNQGQLSQQLGKLAMDELSMSSAEVEAAVIELVFKYIRMRYLITEAAAMLNDASRWMVGLNDYQAIMQGYQQEVQRWSIECADGKAFDHLNKSAESCAAELPPLPVGSVVSNSISDSVTLLPTSTAASRYASPFWICSSQALINHVRTTFRLDSVTGRVLDLLPGDAATKSCSVGALIIAADAGLSTVFILLTRDLMLISGCRPKFANFSSSMVACMLSLCRVLYAILLGADYLTACLPMIAFQTVSIGMKKLHLGDSSAASLYGNTASIAASVYSGSSLFPAFGVVGLSSVVFQGVEKIEGWVMRGLV